VIDRAYLTLLMGPTIPVPAPQPVVDALMSVQVTIASDQRSGFQLVFALSRESTILRVLQPAGFFDPNIRSSRPATILARPRSRSPARM
jgi:hypothetical protein